MLGESEVKVEVKVVIMRGLVLRTRAVRPYCHICMEIFPRLALSHHSNFHQSASLRLQAPTDSEDEHSIQLHGFPGQSQIRTIYGLSEPKH